MSTSEPPYDPNQCMACRGTGKLTSGLGGTPHEVVCPWCEGTGVRMKGIDAQAHPSEDGPAAAASKAPAEPTASDQSPADAAP